MSAGRASARRALLLDALGTLLELEPPAPVLVQVLRERFAIPVSESQAEHAIAAEIHYYRAHLDEGKDTAGLARLRRRCAEVLRAGLPASDSIAALENAALTDALLSSLRFRAFPDANPAILAAREGGCSVVVVSNWDISLHDVLERVGLAARLDGVITSAQAGARKPSSCIFEQALELAGTRPELAVHVGDSLVEDVAGARAAGIEAILLSRDGAPGPSGVRTITSLRELAEQH